MTNWFSYDPFICTASRKDPDEEAPEERQTSSKVIYNKEANKQEERT